MGGTETVVLLTPLLVVLRGISMLTVINNSKVVVLLVAVLLVVMRVLSVVVGVSIRVSV